MEELLVALLVILAAVGVATAAAVTAVVLLVRAALRRVRPTADRVRLTARSYGPGPGSEVARLRLDLRSAVSASERVLATARASGWTLGDAPALQRRLGTATAALDAELRGLELEPDPRRQAAALPDARVRVATVVRSAADLRQGLLRGASRLGADELGRLARDCSVEARALGG
jgi:hypothetical protein